jgi:hypothetical protein
MPAKKTAVPALIAGPYRTPRCRVGRLLACSLRGDVPVDGITDALIPWPYTRYRGEGVYASPLPILILCGELERAVRTESCAAVAAHWGVNRGVVSRWRRHLGVSGWGTTPGDKQLLIDHARFKLTDRTPAEIAEIRERIEAGERTIDIARAVGCPARTVSRVRHGRIFRL